MKIKTCLAILGNMGMAISGTKALFWIAILVGVAGALREWLMFPLGAPLNGLHTYIAWRGQSVGVISFAPIYLALMFVGVCAWLKGYLPWSMAFFSAATAILLVWPIYVLLAGDHWLEQYIRESMRFADMQEFLAKYFIPNSGLDKPQALIPAFGSLSERISVVVAALGTGWCLAILSALLLFGVQLSAMNSTKRTIALLGPVLLFPVMALMLGWNTWRAEYARINADDLLAAGQYASAIEQYQFALAHDPLLKLADSLLLNLSRAHYAVAGEASPAAQIYLASTDMQVSQFDSALLRLQFLPALSTHSSQDNDIFQDFSRRMQAANHKNLGRILYEQGDVVGASREYRAGLANEPQALEIRFFLVKVKLDQRLYRACADDMLVLTQLTTSTKIQADFYSTLADCYIGLGDEVNARLAYATAYKLDARENYRALKGLSGT